ncbi:hypothetical protein V5N11_020902 [Cardamine amara subsp. amara]|uniref:Uncharacterized protein n=1 Tax=Cardamine amara subsp. amara TaxID=228776 RepID=A0ABD0Z8W9_CARAN
MIEEMGIEQTTTSSAVCCIHGHSPVNFSDMTEEEDLNRVICVTDNNNNTALPEGYLDYGQEIDIEQLIDFKTPFESYLDDFVFENISHQDLEEAAASVEKF